jgi:regulator of sigma D
MISAETQADPIHSKSIPVLIAKLLAERQQILVLFNRLVELKTSSAVAAVQSLLQQFCQTLVDYMALGHFEVYQSLDKHARDSECCRHLRQLARQLYPGIVATTQSVLAFNDCYDCQEHCEIRASFWKDLSQLGEELARRIELEDRLITAVKAPDPSLITAQLERLPFQVAGAGQGQ